MLTFWVKLLGHLSNLFSCHLFFLGWRQFQVMIGTKPEEIITVQEIIKGKSMCFLCLVSIFKHTLDTL